MQVVSNLLQLMDNAGRDPKLLYNMQAHLFQAIFRAQLAAGDIKRARMRIAQGKSPDWQGQHAADILAFVEPAWTLLCSPESAVPDEWETEAIVAARIIRQLSDIGDGLAWRIYNHDRGTIVALADHAPIGPISAVDKRRGLESEVEAIVAAYRDRGHFALMHDLTSVLRHTDLTELHPSGYRELQEVKASATKSSSAKASKQRRAAEAALDAAAGLHDLNLSNVRIVRLDTQLRTHIRGLESVLATAMMKGYVVTRVADRLIGALYFPTIAKSGADFVETYGQFKRDVEKTAQRMMPTSMHRLQGYVTLQDTDRPPFYAPFSVWPLPVSQRAALICDYMYIETLLDSEVVRRSLETASGDAVRCNLTPDEVFTIVGTDSVRTIHAFAIRQLLAEFITTDCFASASTEDVSQEVVKKHYVHVFANERAAWR